MFTYLDVGNCLIYIRNILFNGFNSHELVICDKYILNYKTAFQS